MGLVWYLVSWASSTLGWNSTVMGLNKTFARALIPFRCKHDANTSRSLSLRTATLAGMELGLALRLAAPLPCLSRRSLSPPQAFLSPFLPRGRCVRASRLEHGVGVGFNASMLYSRMEEEVEDEDEAEPTESIMPRLELIEKPDRSLAMLDEYGSEELGTHGPNHLSG
jgi:hypothetical protein